ncbi:hypothetical protein KC340_g11815 [Hortaea werneckii]|nr:hypothetical protein KC342_g12128 [Hortaea werneckii]KAI7079856.1 hypothetical protein KC339_g13558 [Hortaea werneckii]KAI7228785.1 hypothetical protein KC365_g8316 [Hortaea werneckii]KAI7306013.1 hypothetical protein KC340_g11815 [Hortaea werneckii]KAI7389626.1 hypothetical protein KC328_g8345 [Hortaea werneckii]
MASLANNLLDADLVNFAIECEDRVFNVHRAVVCAKSNGIKAMVDPALTVPGHVRVFINDFDQHTIERMLCVAVEHQAKETIKNFAGDVESPSPSSLTLVYAGPRPFRSKDHAAISRIRLHAIGKRYEVTGLAALALEKLCCPETYTAAGNFMDVLRVAYQYSAEETDAVRDELFAVVLAQIDNLAANQVFLTQLAEVEELREFAAQLLPHAFKFSAVRHSKSEDEHAKLLALKHETIRLMETEVEMHDARADIYLAKVYAMSEKYDGEVTKNERLEKLLTERSKQLEVATAKVADLESAPSQDPAQSEASETEILRLQELLKAEQARAAQNQMQFDKSALELQSFKLQVHDRESKIQNLGSQALELQQLAGKYLRERDEAREKLRKEAASGSVVAEGVIDLVDSNDACRHCGEPQDWWFEWDGSNRAGSSGLTFRCGQCTTRHW